MSTFTQILYQIVYCTKYRSPSLKEENRTELYKYIWGILKNKHCVLYQIGGIEDHLHIVTHLHASVALADLVKDIKLSSAEFIKNQYLFPDFNGWQEGYAAFTYSMNAKENLISYVKNQEDHHRKKTFTEELKGLLQEHRITFDEKYLL